LCPHFPQNSYVVGFAAPQSEQRISAAVFFGLGLDLQTSTTAISRITMARINAIQPVSQLGCAVLGGAIEVAVWGLSDSVEGAALVVPVTVVII